MADTKYMIQELTWPEKTFLTIREVVRFDQMPDFFKRSYSRLFGVMGEYNVSAQMPPCGIYYSVNEPEKVTDMAAAVAVDGFAGEAEGVEIVVLPPSKVLMTTYFGPYSEMAPAYKALEDYAKSNSQEVSLMIEEYFTDPSIEPDQSKWKTNIYFVLK